MSAANVVAKFTADTGDLRQQMAAAEKSFGAVSDAALISRKHLEQVGNAMADVGKKMTVGVTLPIGGVGVAAATAAMSFESSMAKIIGLVGITSDAVADMGSEILNMAGYVGKAPEELADGLFVVTSAGLRGAEAMSALKVAAMAGAAGLGETNDIARAVSGALSAYGSDVISASEATDAIVATARAGNFETSQFAAAIGRVLPFAEQAGASFQDMGGAVALLTRVNGNAAESITQIQALFRAVVVPTEEAKTAFDEMGMSAADLRASIAERGLPATLQMLDKALGGNREQLGRILGSSEAASAAFQILNADAQTINDTFGVVQDSAGMTAEAFGVVAQTTQFQLNAAMSDMKAGLVEIGESLLPIIQAVIDFAARWISGFNSLPAPLKNMIVIMAGLAAAVGPVLFVVGKLIVVFSTLMSLMLKARAISALRGMFTGLRTEMALTRTSMAQTQTSFAMLGTAAHMARTTVIASFRMIAVAAKGLIAAFGPIGIAIVGVTVILDSFMGRAAEMENIISSLRDEVDLTTQSLTKAGEQLAAQKIFELISPEDRAALEAYGISMAEVLEAVINGGPAMESLQEKLAGFRDLEVNPFGRMGADEIRQDIELMRAGVEGSIEAANSLSEANENAALRVSDAARGMAGSYREAAAAKRKADRDMTDSQRALDGALEAGITAVEGLETAFLNLQTALSDEASVDNAYRAINRLKEELGDGEKTLSGYSDAALDNREAIRQAAQAWKDYAAATQDPEESQRRLAEGQREIRDALKEAGIKPEESDIFKTMKAQQQQSKETVDEFAKQRDKAAQYGNDVGANFIDGIITELERRRAEVEAAAAAATSAMNTGGNAGVDASSPSRTAMEVAKNWTDGLVIGLRRGSKEVEGEASKAAKRIAKQFMALMQPTGGGAATSAFEAMFGTREDIRNSGRALQDATWDLADARDAVVEAEKAVAEARKEGNAREIAAAERDLARARRDAADAADAKKAAEFTAENQKALLALEKIAQKYDYITNALNEVTGALTALTDLVAQPFGLGSALSEMFTVGMDPQALARNFASISSLITDAYAVLLDPKIVGRKAARANRREMNGIIREVEGFVAEIIALQQEYDANLEQMAKNEEQFRIDEKRLTDELNKVTKAFDQANRELDRIERERDGFVRGISDGFRKFVNSLSGLTAGVTEEVTKETQELANGVRFIIQTTQRESVSGAAAIAANLQSRLAEVREFSANIRTLMERGLDPAMVRDFIESGVSGAGETVAALAGATDAELQAINETQAALLQHAEEFATAAGEDYYGALIREQRGVVAGLQAEVDAAQKALDDARAAYEAERARLEAENERIEGDITALAARIEALITDLAATLPAETMQAGQDAVDNMIAGFEQKFPEMKDRFGALMDELAASMERTVRVNVRTVGAVNSGRSQARSFSTGTVPLASSDRGRSVTIGANAVNVTVTGATGNSANIGAEVRRAVDESLQELAREIVAA